MIGAQSWRLLPPFFFVLVSSKVPFAILFHLQKQNNLSISPHSSSTCSPDLSTQGASCKCYTTHSASPHLRKCNSADCSYAKPLTEQCEWRYLRAASEANSSDCERINTKERAQTRNRNETDGKVRLFSSESGYRWESHLW